MSHSTKSKSKASGKQVAQQVEEPVVVAAPVEVAAPVVVEKKSTKKSSAKEAVAAPVQEAAVVADTKSKKSSKTEKSAKSAKAEKPAKVEKSAKQTKSTKSEKSAKTSKKAAKPKAAKQEVEADGEEGEQEKGKRYFHCVYKGNDGKVVRAGRYCGKKPKQAARKALSRVVEKNGVEDGKTLVFLIKECTRGSKKKMYAYNGSRVPLQEPVKVELKKLNKDGKPVVLTYKHANNVKKVALAECGDLVNVNFEEEEQEVVQEAAPAPTVKVTKKSSAKATKEAVPVTTPVVAPVEEAPKKVKGSKKEEAKPVEASPAKEEVKVEKTKTKSKSK